MPSAFRILLLFCLGLCCAFAPMGCTNDTTSSAGFVTRAVTFKIEWGDIKSNADGSVLIAPSQARSASLMLMGANPNGSDLMFPAKRNPARQDSYIDTYPVPSPVRVGPTVLVAVFYLQANPTPTDAPIGMLKAPQQVAEKGATTITISTANPPASVVILPGQTVLAGHSLPLKFTPLDKNQSQTPIDPGSSNVAIIIPAPGNSYLTPSSSYATVDAQSVSGTALVQVEVKTSTATGVVSTLSQPEAVTVLPNIRIAIDPATDPISVATGFHDFTAHVTNVDNTTPLNPNVDWMVVGGDVNGTKSFPDPNNPNTVRYTAPPSIKASPMVFTLIARSKLDTSQTATTTITVQGGVGNVTFQ